MTTAISSPDRFGSLLRGLLRKNIPNMVYLALIGFVGIPLPYLLAMFHRWEDQVRDVHHLAHLLLCRIGGDQQPVALQIQDTAAHPRLRGGECHGEVVLLLKIPVTTTSDNSFTCSSIFT